MTHALKPKKRVWTPPNKQEHAKKVATVKAGGFASLQKYVGTSHKPKTPKASKRPTGQVYEQYAQGKDLNSDFSWSSKNGMQRICDLDTQHLVGIIGYLYWGNHKHKWLVLLDPKAVYHQQSMTFTGEYVRDAFDAIIVELVKVRKEEITPVFSDRLRKIVKHVVVQRARIKKQAKKQEQPTA